jgi:hypothetical protein
MPKSEDGVYLVKPRGETVVSEAPSNLAIIGRVYPYRKYSALLSARSRARAARFSLLMGFGS